MNAIKILILLTLTTTTVLAQMPMPHVTDSGASIGMATVVTATSSVQAITNARTMVAKNPKSADGYVALGLALCHEGEERPDASLYGEADDALNKALELAPHNFEAEKGRVCVALGHHEFARAREMATVLNKQVPDDVIVYGLLVDANVALGNYNEAEKAAQWMLNLRPGNTPALIRAARLREVFGDQEGAIELLRLVLDATAPGDFELRARTLTQIAHLNLETGDLEAAEAELHQVLVLLPNDRGALNNMAQTCLLRGRPAEAVRLVRQSYKGSPELDTLYALAEAMEAAGMKDEARNAFTEFERQAQADSSNAANANRELIFYYADHANKPVQALQVAEQEIAHRDDVYTLDAYAWALHKNGRNAEAKKQMETALNVGVREATVFYHAGEIELRLGNLARAEHYFREAVEMNSANSEQARTALAALRPGHHVPR